MIVDNIKNLEQYLNLNSNLKTVIKFLETLDFDSLVNGKNEIDGKNLWVLKEEYVPRGIEDCYFERHNNYLDIQYVYEGQEFIGYENIMIANPNVTDEYNNEKDVEKAQLTSFSKVLLNTGMFALVMPQDWHMPKLNSGENKVVKKLVFKLKI